MQRLRLVHLATIKNLFGTHTISVLINDVEYDYDVGSQYEADKFIHLMKHSRGKALCFLKKVAIDYSKINVQEAKINIASG